MAYTGIMSGNLKAPPSAKHVKAPPPPPPAPAPITRVAEPTSKVTASAYGAVPNTDIGARPELSWLPMAKLYVDPRYQREVSHDGRENVCRMIEGFRWRDFGTLLVAAMPDGRYAIIDGQHRYLAACCHPAVTEVPCVVIRADEVREQAKSFVAVNRDRKALNPYQLHHANLAAGDKDTVRLQAVVAAAGMAAPRNHLTADAYRPKHLRFPAVLAKLVFTVGDDHTVAALRICRRAAEAVAKGQVRGPIVTAVAGILAKHGDVDHDRLVKVLTDRPGDELQQAAIAYRKMFGGSTGDALRMAIIKAYNEALRADRRLPEGGGDA